ncbi:MAG: hypothetical protein ACTSRE_05050 [Promethearchaeota archaeon]
MPLKIHWSQGRYLGISLLFIGVMGLVQALIVIPFGQYAVDVGSLYVLILIPIVSTILLTYSAQVLYGAYAKNTRKRIIRGKKWVVKVRTFLHRELIRPPFIVIIVFLVVFFLFYGIFSAFESVNTFVIAENVGTIGVLVLSTVLEKRIAPDVK